VAAAAQAGTYMCKEYRSLVARHIPQLWALAELLARDTAQMEIEETIQYLDQGLQWA
jgi:hypothetical protein